MEITIRKARKVDLMAIDELTNEMHNYLGKLYGLKLSDEELEEEHMNQKELKNVYVAEAVDGLVVGYVCFSKGKDEWRGPHYEIGHIVVREDHRRLGIGRKLFGKLLERATREGANIAVGTLARDKGALRFYKRLGFKPLSMGLLLDLQKRLSSKSPTTS